MSLAWGTYMYMHMHMHVHVLTCTCTDVHLFITVTMCVHCFCRELEKLLTTSYYTKRLLPIKSRSQIFVPLIEMLDYLLVMGVVQSEGDIQRLLMLLSPDKLAPKSSAGKKAPFSLSLSLSSVHISFPSKYTHMSS